MNFSEAAIKRAESELLRRREANALLRKVKMDKAFKKAPEIKEIDERLSASVPNVVASLFDSRKKIGPQTKANIEELIEKRRELLKKNQLPPDVFDEIFTCGICKDRGYIAESGARCECINEIARKVMAQEAGFSGMDLPTFDDFNIDFYDPVQSKRGRTYREIAAAILRKARGFKEGNVCICGKVGLGKTFLAECIAGEFIRQNRVVCYLSSTRLFLLLDENTFGKNPPEALKQQISLIYDAELLIIDDLGAEFRSSFTESMLFDILNTRLRDGKSTIISTNLSADEIKAAYSERVSSRILGQFERWEFLGDDIRKKIAARR